MKNSYQYLFFITFFITSLKGQIPYNRCLCEINPCPNVFQYARDNRNGEIVGFLRIPASVQQLQYSVQVKTTVPFKFNPINNFVGHIEPLEKGWQQACTAISNGNLNYKIYFPIQNPVPVIQNIFVNDRPICFGPRPNSFVSTDMNLGSTVRFSCPFNTALSLGNIPFIPQQRFQSPIQGSPAFSPRPIQHIPNPFQVNPATTPKIPIQHDISVPVNDVNDYFDETLFQNNYICGEKARTSNTTPLIINGKNSAKGDYPWLAGLYYNDKHICAGNLISNQHIITAAHCITGNKPYEIDNFQVVLGAHELSKSLDPDVIERKPIQIFIHPDYNNHIEDKADGDIAIISFGIISFTEYIKPICLFKSMPDISNEEGKIAKVAGWGSDGKNHITQTIKETNVRIVSKRQCKNSHPELVKLVTSRTFCAGHRGTGPCTGDSGGGIYLPIEESNENNEKYYLRGLISTTLMEFDTCDVTNYAVYVDIGKFIPWIRKMYQQTQINM